MSPASLFPCSADAFLPRKCPEDHTCLQGFGKSPDYDYTNFDSFNSALLSAFRLMTQDAWEQLYQQVLRATGSAHILFFVAAIFLGSIYLVNLILAIVAMSYDELSKKAQDEAEAVALEESNFQESQKQDEAELLERRRSSRCHRSPLHHSRLSVAALARDRSSFPSDEALDAFHHPPPALAPASKVCPSRHFLSCPRALLPLLLGCRSLATAPTLPNVLPPRSPYERCTRSSVSCHDCDAIKLWNPNLT